MESMELLPARVRITAILKKALFSGEYKSGDELSLTDIAAKLGVSRTPVREAFQALEAEGLIELRMNKGAIVKPIDEKYITDHYEMRILLESEAAARAAKNGMPDADPLIEKLMDIQKRMESLSTSEYENLNFDVHSSIWTAADNMRLQDAGKFVERAKHRLYFSKAGALHQIHPGAYRYPDCYQESRCQKSTKRNGTAH